MDICGMVFMRNNLRRYTCDCRSLRNIFYNHRACSYRSIITDSHIFYYTNRWPDIYIISYNSRSSSIATNC